MAGVHQNRGIKLLWRIIELQHTEGTDAAYKQSVQSHTYSKCLVFQANPVILASCCCIFLLGLFILERMLVWMSFYYSS